MFYAIWLVGIIAAVLVSAKVTAKLDNNGKLD
ncbi:cytochrome bd oxidase small subunit, CydX/CbdX family [Exercitatus varius]